MVTCNSRPGHVSKRVMCAQYVPNDAAHDGASTARDNDRHCDDSETDPTRPAARVSFELDRASKVSAHEADAALRQPLDELLGAERNAVLWFAEIARRKLYLELGYASIHQYASEALGFSNNKTGRFLRLAADLERLPGMRAAPAKGESAGRRRARS